MAELRNPLYPSGRPELTAGQVLGGRYRIEKKLGIGGMGEVWAAEHVTLHTRVAAKVLLGVALECPEIAARFQREALLLAMIRSEHLPHALDFLADDVFGPVLVSELVEGESLASVLAEPLSIEQAVDLGIELTTGIAEIHRAGVVHRDLKPGNVIMRPIAGGKTRAVIIDLGVGRLVLDATAHDEGADITSGELVVGTVAYMAPEQILRCAEVTPAADLYALGALLFRAVTGGHVFGAGLDKLELVRIKLTGDAPALPTTRHDPVARGLVTVLARALQRNPAQRYQTADELRSDLIHLRELAAGRAARAEAATGARPACAEPASGVSSAFSAVRELVRSVGRRIGAAAMTLTRSSAAGGSPNRVARPPA